MNEILKALKKYAEKNQVAIAEGDNYPVIKILMSLGITFYWPHEPYEPLTGDEKKERTRDLGPLFETEYKRRQPARAHFEPNDKSPFIPIIPPQDFPKYMKDGVIKIAIGAGYDIQVDYLKVKPLPLNGEFEKPEDWEETMRRGLEKANMVGENLKIKPVMFPLIAYRPMGIETLDDAKEFDDRNGGMRWLTEFPHISKQYCTKKNIKPKRMRKVYGGAEKQIASGLGDIGTDIVETGGTIIEDAGRINLVMDNDGKPITIMYSTPWILTTEEEYRVNKKFFDKFFQAIREGVSNLLEKYPSLAEPKFTDFYKKFEDREGELGLK